MLPLPGLLGQFCILEHVISFASFTHHGTVTASVLPKDKSFIITLTLLNLLVGTKHGFFFRDDF